MKKQGERKELRSIVIEDGSRFWCKECDCTKREGELSDCLRHGHQLIERKLTINKLV